MKIRFKKLSLISMICSLSVFFLLKTIDGSGKNMKSRVEIYPAPIGEKLSGCFKVAIEGRTIPVYVCKVSSGDRDKRFKVVDHATRSAYYEEGGFAYFDMQGPVTISVMVQSSIHEARILPQSAGIHASWTGNTLVFQLANPRLLEIEINGDIIHSLQLFANPLEKDRPAASDPHVLYFGPGEHEFNFLNIKDNETLYIAGGAVLRATIDPKESFKINPKDSLKNYSRASIQLVGKHITCRGRGIIDASACPVRAKNLFFINGTDIKVEGVILRDAGGWTIPVRRSDSVIIDNVKLLGYRANSDGIDICNSRNVTVQNCFIRTGDDLVVVKTDRGQGPGESIVVRKCVLWNQVAHALSIGAEIREPISHVLFADCDVLHDLGREWTLRIYQCDAAAVSNIQFENIRIEDCLRPISLWIGKAIWSRDTAYGSIRNVVFKDITVAGDKLVPVNLEGADRTHLIENVSFDQVRFNGSRITGGQVNANEFVESVAVTP